VNVEIRLVLEEVQTSMMERTNSTERTVQHISIPALILTPKLTVSSDVNGTRFESLNANSTKHWMTINSIPNVEPSIVND
jgi:hypothetical protein